jgi:glutamate 5-kinase
MATKLAAAKIAAWSGVRTVIAAAERRGVVVDAMDEVPGVGTVVRPRPRTLPARKLWIAFAVGSSGTVVVDAGARRALQSAGRSLLPAGVVGADGRFAAGAAVEVADEDGEVFAKGVVALGADALRAVAGARTGDLPDGTPREVIHRDDLVVLPP